MPPRFNSTHELTYQHDMWETYMLINMVIRDKYDDSRQVYHPHLAHVTGRIYLWGWSSEFNLWVDMVAVGSKVSPFVCYKIGKQRMAVLLLTNPIQWTHGYIPTTTTKTFFIEGINVVTCHRTWQLWFYNIAHALSVMFHVANAVKDGTTRCRLFESGTYSWL